ncbi:MULTISPECIES: hypothetical protein [Halocynthiibacter]|uniref:Uncharacterized protein n=1 Tax=Halocynthiibacter halioticoli TaxID=2986804 RepID=A0AAE3J1H7_9RHOB|nr:MULTISPECIES: hypothetical protein [Halocynthiibacter]MCV6826000.1 hypothetical protein [Halocynthiibacter halioticoli]MCW4059001.1 hypothetical protein [Halocynthiibacter sp. SDUM655004]
MSKLVGPFANANVTANPNGPKMAAPSAAKAKLDLKSEEGKKMLMAMLLNGMAGRNTLMGQTMMNSKK